MSLKPSKRKHKHKLKGSLVDLHNAEVWADIRLSVETKTVRFVCIKCLTNEQKDRKSRVCDECA